MTVKLNITNNDVFWLRTNLIHNNYGPAIINANGTKEWWVNGQRHRLDGPAIDDADGYTRWHINGKIHRLDGPAVEFADGEKFWYINHVEYTYLEYLIALEQYNLSKENI